MSVLQIGVSVVLALIVIYVVVRISTMAFYKSKQQFDNQQRKPQ